jgi:hypothetical protein
VLPIFLLLTTGIFFGSIQLFASSQIVFYSSILVLALITPPILFILSQFVLWIATSLAGNFVLTNMGLGSLVIFSWGTSIYTWFMDSVFTPGKAWFASNWCGILSLAGVEQCDSSNWYYYAG